MSKWPRPKYLTDIEIKVHIENPDNLVFANSDFDCDEDDEIVYFSPKKKIRLCPFYKFQLLYILHTTFVVL